MRRALIVWSVLASVAAGVLPSVPAYAHKETCQDGDPNCSCGFNPGGEFRCWLIHEHDDHEPPGGGPPAEVDTRVWVTYPELDTSGDPPCIRQKSRKVEQEDEHSFLSLVHRTFFLIYEHLLITSGIEDCPGESASWTVSRAVRAELVTTLPPFTPITDPGKALAGKELYLDTGADMTWHSPSAPATWNVTDPVSGISYTITIWGDSQLQVDWGDGTPIELYDSAGGPWDQDPSKRGDVTHVYTDRADSRTITVEQLWDIHWTFGGNSGTIHDFSLGPRTTPPFRVWELQPVRER